MGHFSCSRDFGTWSFAFQITLTSPNELLPSHYKCMVDPDFFHHFRMLSLPILRATDIPQWTSPLTLQVVDPDFHYFRILPILRATDIPQWTSPLTLQVMDPDFHHFRILPILRATDIPQWTSPFTLWVVDPDFWCVINKSICESPSKSAGTTLVMMLSPWTVRSEWRVKLTSFSLDVTRRFTLLPEIWNNETCHF